MTPQETINSLIFDFRSLVETIVNNNPLAVRNNIAKVYDASNIENKPAMVDLIMQFQQIGHTEIVSDILDVPFIEANATPELRQAYTLAVTQATMGAKFSDWSGGLFSAIGQIGASALGGGSDAPTTAPAPVIIEQKNNTMLYVIGGIIAVVLIIVAVKVMRKGK